MPQKLLIDTKIVPRSFDLPVEDRVVNLEDTLVNLIDLLHKYVFQLASEISTGEGVTVVPGGITFPIELENADPGITSLATSATSSFELVQSGAAKSFSIVASGSGIVMDVNNTGSSTVLDIDNSTSSAIGVNIANSGTGHSINIDNTSSGTGVDVTNTTGVGIEVTGSSTGLPMVLTSTGGIPCLSLVTTSDPHILFDSVDPLTPASGEFWHDTPLFKFYNGSNTEIFMSTAGASTAGIIAATDAANSWVPIVAGTNNQILTYDTGETGNMKWAAPGAVTLPIALGDTASAITSAKVTDAGGTTPEYSIDLLNKGVTEFCGGMRITHGEDGGDTTKGDALHIDFHTVSADAHAIHIVGDADNVTGGSPFLLSLAAGATTYYGMEIDMGSGFAGDGIRVNNSNSAGGVSIKVDSDADADGLVVIHGGSAPGVSITKNGGGAGSGAALNINCSTSEDSIYVNQTAAGGNGARIIMGSSSDEEAIYINNGGSAQGIRIIQNTTDDKAHLNLSDLGADPATPEVGDIWRNGDNLKFESSAGTQTIV